MLKQPKKPIFIYLILSMFALFLGRSHVESYWSPKESLSKRAPSSEALPVINPALFSDFFSKDKEMRVEFWSDRNNSVQKRGYLAFQEAISKTVLAKEPNKLSPKIFNENIFKSFSKEFLKALSQLEVKDGIFQIDLHFEPKKHREFRELMDSNQLIDNKDKGELLSSLEDKPLSFDKQVLRRIPQKQKDNYHSLGGSITIWFNLTALTWPLSISDESSLDGFIKYRRYFSMNRDWSPKLNIDNKSEFKGIWENKSSPRLVTVDTTSPFNSNSLEPVPQKLEIYFGELKFPKKYKTGIVDKRDLFSKDTKVNKLLIESERTSFHIKSLEFNLAELRFSNSSKIKSFGRWNGFSTGQKRKRKREIRRSLLGSQSKELIKEFSLYRFDDSFKQVGER